MNYSIKIANNSKSTMLRVGAVLVTDDNKLTITAYSSEYLNLSWSDVLLLKVNKNKQNIEKIYDLFLTINTLMSSEDFNLNYLIKKINIRKVYIGLPDPNLSEYLPSDPVITLKKVYRYTDKLQRQILEQNKDAYKNSKQSIQFNLYYSKLRISKMVLGKLQKKGFVISKEELETHKQVDEIVEIIIKKYKLDYDSAWNLLNNILSKSFDEKYSSYDYSNDVRSLNINWKTDFFNICNQLFTSSIENKKILNVGVGSGNEAIELFNKCKNITFVDIAPTGLRQIKEQKPDASVLVTKAENLSDLPSSSYDLYVSLRTYNSSFFDIERAVSEAYRVLKPRGVIIVSIANGFLHSKKRIIVPGLIIPKTEFVDIYRGVDMTEKLSSILSKLGFKSITFFPKKSELYLSAVKEKT